MDGMITGGCLCGATRYAYAAEVGPASYCHCEDCRRCTGSAFNVGVRMAAEHFTITDGNPKGFTKTADSGHELTRHFCRDCGSPIYTSSPRHSGQVFVKAGSLDDPGLVRPHHQAWAASTVPWAVIDGGLSASAKDKD